MRLTVGIDPGLRGGVAALDVAGAVVGLWPMPVAGGEVHAAGLADLLRSLRCLDRLVQLRGRVHDSPGDIVRVQIARGE